MNPANSQEALSQLQSIQAASQDPNTILANQNQQLGVQGAQDTVTGLRGAINNTTKMLQQVAPSVMGRTANSLVTNAQASKQIGNESAPIQASLTKEGTDYNQADEDLQTLQQKAQTAANGIYAGQQDKLSYAQNLYNTLYQKEQDAQAAAVAEQARQEQIREFNEQLSASNAAAANSNRQFDLSRSDAQAAAAQPAIDAQNAQIASQVNTLRQLAADPSSSGTALGSAIQALRAKAAQGDANAKLIAQKFYAAISKPIPFAEFR